MTVPGLGGVAETRRRTGSRCKAVVAAAVVALAIGVTACASPPPSSGAASGSPGDVAGAGAVTDFPRTQALSGADGTWATLAMGHLGDPFNTFWELFGRSGCVASVCTSTGGWALATPPGVASNGGLLFAATAPGALTVGFGAAINLQFSPLAETADGGSTWSSGVLPGALAQVPDALAVSGRSLRMALLSGRGGEVVSSRGDINTWTPVLTERALATATRSSGCALEALTALDVGASGPGSPGQAYAGGACRDGSTVPIYRLEGGTGLPIGPHLRVPVGTPIRVDRLVTTDAGLTALVTTGSGRSAELVLAASADGAAPWSVSAPLATAGRSVESTSVTPTGGIVVVLSGTRDPETASVVSTGSSWRPLPPLPTSTSVVVAEAGGQYEALVASGSTLRVYDLVAGNWQKREGLDVPIQYGSSG